MRLHTSVFPRLKSVAIGVAAAGLALATALGTAGPATASVSATASGSASASSQTLVPAVSPLSRPLTTTCSADYLNGDFRLGPAGLPNSGYVGYELKGYRRTGNLSTTTFLARYYDSTANSGAGGWIYPPDSGYQLRRDGSPIVWRKTLRVGQDLDRFGSEYGAFLSPAGSPYAVRAIPPSNLDGTPAAGCNYHRYAVLKPFDVDAGPIAAWFAQPGGGWQDQLIGSFVAGAPASLNVLWLVNNGYLQRLV
jgi:hypothetical protein